MPLEAAYPPPTLEVASPGSGLARLRHAWGVPLIFFLAVAPTLTWMEFSNQIENLNVETALEIRRGGPWLVPTLMGEPRYRKPPLCAWITAAGIDPEVVRQMSSLDATVREPAWKRLAWQVRWPALLMSALTLGAGYGLGRVLGGPSVGLAGAAIAGSSLLFQRYAVSATTDVPLALWVTCANFCLARLIFPDDGRTVPAGLTSGGSQCAGERAIGRGEDSDREGAAPRRPVSVWFLSVALGAALGLGMMSKGPVTFVMTLLPAGVFVAWRWWLQRPMRVDRRLILPLAVGTVLMLVVGFWWFAYVLWIHPQGLQTWWWEVLRTDPSEAATASWYDYIKLLPLMAPSTLLLLAGLFLAGRATLAHTFRRLPGAQNDAVQRLIFAGTLILVPIVVMSFFRDRKPRYLYPFAIPAGILTAQALFWLARTRVGAWLRWGHWGIVAVVVIGLPIVGATGAFDRVRVDGSPWFSPGQGAGLATLSVAIVAAGAWLTRKHVRWLAPATLVAMLYFQAVLTAGKSVNRSGDGVSEMLPIAQILWQRYPDVVPYDLSTLKKRIPPDLAIYLNRPIRKARSVEEIAPGPHPVLYIDRHKPSEPEPAPAEGFSVLARVPRDRDTWVA
ncbi:MAG: glycosyltransferase family 39 protein, partial [Phycisphaerae bacterium]|nr:glycosyltransferase family 39 protein [Phycisphaerae bacterium]MDW8263389.1 glycosyltransferase family 39 protein [Phycisphaerales bacterium]